MIDITVIIPVHNDETTIRRAVKSAFRDEKLLSIEVIAVLNGSVDKSEQILQKDFPQVRLLHSEKGRSRARNLGLRAARGRYINFLDADDELLENHLRRAVRILDSSNNMAYVDGGIEYVDETSSRLLFDYGQIVSPNDELLKRNIFPINNPVFTNTSNLVEFWEDLEYNEDHVFWLQNLANEKIYLDSNNVGSRKYVTGRNTMTEHKAEMVAGRFAVEIAKKMDDLPGERSVKKNLLALIKYQLFIEPNLTTSKIFAIKYYPILYRVAAGMLSVASLKKFFVKKYSM